MTRRKRDEESEAQLVDDDDDAGEDVTVDNPVIIPVQRTPWLEIARDDIGLKEIRGRRHEPRILEMFKLAGHGYIVNDETAWCAAAMCAWLERAGVASPKTLSARQFQRWGREIKEPKVGCIVVMWRGSPHGWQGHVGIYLGEAQGGRAIRVLGGNQRNGVNVAEFAKERRYKGRYYPAVLSYRMPRRVLKTAAAGAVSAVAGAGATAAGSVAAVAGDANTVTATRNVAENMAASGDPTLQQIALYIMIALSVVSAAAAAYAAFQRYLDHRNRGV